MSEVLTYCENHPDRETSLRCNRCNKLICSQCAIQTPTGYRCEECVRGQQKVFNTAQTQDYVLSFAVAAILSYIGALIASRIGFFTIFLAPAAGTIIAEAIRRVVNRRRSKQLFQVALAGIVLGAAPFLLFPFLAIFLGGGLGSLFSLLWPGLYLAIAASTAYYRMSGIQLGR
jgi:MFS family permease